MEKMKTVESPEDLIASLEKVKSTLSAVISTFETEDNFEVWLVGRYSKANKHISKAVKILEKIQKDVD